MKVFFKLFLLWIYLVNIIINVIINKPTYAEIRRDRIDSVVLGEWISSNSKNNRGYLLPIKKFIPGKKIYTRILLENSYETISIKFFIETLDKCHLILNKQFQDNDSNDFFHEEKGILVLEMISIPFYPVCRYLIEVNDFSGQKSVIRYLESNFEPTKLKNKVKQIIFDTAKKLWQIPEKISSDILSKERAIESSLNKLVIVDSKGKILSTMIPAHKKIIEYPLWLPDNRILFIEKDEKSSLIKEIGVNLQGNSKNFGQNYIEGNELFITPDHQSIIFRQKNRIVLSNLTGSKLLPIIIDKKINQILGLLKCDDGKDYFIVYTAYKENLPVNDLWVSQVYKSSVISSQIIPYSAKWLLLSKIKFFGKKVFYEKNEISINGKIFWQIYYSNSFNERGEKLIKGNNTFSFRYPAWNLSGTKIVLVTNFTY